jgi:hypothetical protein
MITLDVKKMKPARTPVMCAHCIKVLEALYIKHNSKNIRHEIYKLIKPKGKKQNG